MIRHSFPRVIASRTLLHRAALICFAVSVLPRVTQAATAVEADLLERAGQRVKQFWDELSSVTCTETLLQEKLNQKGRVTLNNKSSYDYLISAHWDGSGMLVDESRLPVGEAKKKAPQSSLLATQGFAALLTIFHPEFQPGYSFSIEGSDTEGSRALMRVAFLPRKGAPSPAALSLKDRMYPIEWEGVAWIDPQLAVITRLVAHWKDPAEEIGLQALSSEVHYAPISFRGGAQALWLPELARVEVKTLHQQWRNTHQFSNYRLFSVETQTKTGEVKQ